MSDHDDASIIWLILAAVIFVLGVWFGWEAHRSGLRNEAVKAGAAHWTPGEHGGPEFTWGPEDRNAE